MSEEDNWEDDDDKELSQDKNITIHSIWVNPSFLEFFQDPHAVPQDGPCWLSSVGRGAAEDTARDLQSMSPVPEEPMDAEPAAVSLATAPEEEGHCAPLTLIGKEVAKAQESPLLSEQPTAAQAESQAAAPHSPAACAAPLQDTDQWDVSEILHKAVTATQGPNRQLVEQRDPAQTMHVVTAATTPAASQDSESSLPGEHQREPNSATLVPEECEDGEHTASAMSGDHQGEPSTAIFSPAAHEEDLASLLPQISLADAAAPHLDRAGEDETDSTWSPLSWDSWHQVSQGRVTSTEHHELLQAGAVSRPCAAGRWLVLSVSAR